MWTKEAESMNVITGMFPEMYGKDKYDIDNSWQPRGSVWTLEGTKGGKTYEWGPPPKLTNFWDAITESEKRTIAFIDKAVEAKKPFFISHQPILLGFIPERAVNALSYVVNECADDLDQFCQNVSAGEGRLLECLQKNDAKVSSCCKEARKQVGMK